MTRRLMQVAVLVLGIGVTLLVDAADPTYSVRELTQFARATDINNLGDIVGERHPGVGLLLRSGQSQAEVIGSLGGFTFPKAVNDGAQVVGIGLLGDGITRRAFLYANGVIKDLGTLPGHEESGATAINVKGQIAGWSRSASDPVVHLPFFYSGGRMTVLQVDSIVNGVRQASATAINNRGVAVGNVEAKEGDNDPPYVWGRFRYWSGSLSVGAGGLGGHSSQALDINDNGLMVGWSEPTLESRTKHAVAWFDGAFRMPTDLGVLPGQVDSLATGVNKNAQIVGYSYTGTDVPESRRAFIYMSGWMFDLNGRLEPAAQGWMIREAIAINDSGQIIAEGCDPQGACNKAILLTPNSSTTKPPRRR